MKRHFVDSHSYDANDPARTFVVVYRGADGTLPDHFVIDCDPPTQGLFSKFRWHRGTRVFVRPSGCLTPTGANIAGQQTYIVAMSDIVGTLREFDDGKPG